MTSLEEQLAGWTAPSSDTEQEKQDRTVRMIREAVASHLEFNDCALRVYAKGSYANNTNVRIDSDVDVAVECTEVVYLGESEPGLIPAGPPYEGRWTPPKLRSELGNALKAQFPGQVDASGTTAIHVESGTARVSADVVPCFTYRYHMRYSAREGTRIFRTDGNSIVNYPAQQLENGKAKNKRTGYAFKRAARMLKRVENTLVAKMVSRPLPSYFVECLAYNCPDSVFQGATWTEVLRRILVHIWDATKGDEPEEDLSRWHEVNECFFLFHSEQAWTREDARNFALATWDYFGFA